MSPELEAELKGSYIVNLESVVRRYQSVLRNIELRSLDCVRSRTYLFLKKSIDIVVASIGLLFFSLILPFIAILIRLDSPGPIFFSQPRVGMNCRKGERRKRQIEATAEKRNGNSRRKVDLAGGIFRICKLRTMHMDAEKKTGPIWASEGDPRVTKVGNFLRRTHLDEIPQLLNVLKGEMSLVGPRPERPFFVRQFKEKIPGYCHRLQVLPGIIGLSQTRNGYDSDGADVIRKLRYDIFYISKRCLLMDLILLLNAFRFLLKFRE